MTKVPNEGLPCGESSLRQRDGLGWVQPPDADPHPAVWKGYGVQSP